MLQLGLIQPNFQTGPKHLNSFYLPYTVGLLWSYVKQDPFVNENYELYDMLFRRDNVHEAVEHYKKCDVIIISFYIWSSQYCYRFCDLLKQANPDVKILAGGPDLDWKDKEFFDKHPYIDYLVVSEGEIACTKILQSIAKKEEIKKLWAEPRMKDLDIPSPYTEGLFDDLMAKHTDIEWIPTLETDRGCPYACTFCDWGSLTASKMFKVYFDRIESELKWFADKKLPFMAMTNSNFGIFKDRDMQIAEIIAENKRTTGYPSGISVSYAKNSNKTIVDILKIFDSVKIQTGFVLSLQTGDDDVLEIIKRKNLKINVLSDIVDLANENNIPLLTELIVGLPGETKETWLAGLEKILQSGITQLEVFKLALLVNAPMMETQADDYEYKTFSSYDYFYDTNEQNILSEIEQGIGENIQLVLSNNTMTLTDMRYVLKFTWFLIGMYSGGVSRFIADYLHKNNGVEYMKLHTDMFEYFMQPQFPFKEVLDQMDECLDEWVEQGYVTKKLGGFSFIGWNFISCFTPILHSRNIVNETISDVRKYVEDKYEISTDVLDEYELFTSNFIKQYGEYLTEPKVIESKTDLLPHSTYQFTDRYDQFPETKEEHIELVVFGRRKSWYLNKILSLTNK
jgi:radical SAM superfamily enzyme YgiQ (UPF0313 family)